MPVIHHYPGTLVAVITGGYTLRCRCGKTLTGDEPETVRNAWANHVTKEEEEWQRKM